MDYEFMLSRPARPGEAAGEAFRLAGLSLVRIGRAAEQTDLIVPNEAVSRKHAVLTEDHGVWTIEDLKSSNGTFVNGTEIIAPVRLNPGDEIRFAHDGPMLVFERRPIGEIAPADATVDEATTSEAEAAARRAEYERYVAERSAYDRAVAERAAYDRAVAERAIYDRAIAAGQTPQQAWQHVNQFRAQQQPAVRKTPGGAIRKSAAAPTWSEALPFLSGGGSVLLKPSLLLPILITGVTGLWLFLKSNDQADAMKASDVGAYMRAVYAFDWTLGVYLVVAIAYGVTRLLGNTKPWWVLASSAFWTFMTVWIIAPFVVVALPIYGIAGLLGGREDPSAGLYSHFVFFFIGTGLTEEAFKVVPVFAAILIGRLFHNAWARKAGAFTAVDAIAIGVASATGFTCIETLTQYVPDMIANFYNAKTATNPEAALEAAVIGAGQGLQLLIPRIIGQVAGHMAWTGYFSYMIGLAFASPGRRAWLFIAIGWLGAAFAHGLWDTFAQDNSLLLVVIGVGSILLLVASIRRARFASGVSIPLARKKT